MILSGKTLYEYISAEKLKFDPPLEENQIQQNGVDMILSEADAFSVCAGGFVLGRTREVITMPNNLMAFVHLRSTWARYGFMIPPTVIDAGFHGSITLEITKLGIPGAVPVGRRFAHVIFAELTTPSEPYDGKYQGQIDITPARPD